VEDIPYLTFKNGDKILVKEMFDNGWWWGCVIGEKIDPETADCGYLPSNYVQ
jgi:Variant SH3 domain